jgi:hypothetical protein
VVRLVLGGLDDQFRSAKRFKDAIEMREELLVDLMIRFRGRVE